MPPNHRSFGLADGSVLEEVDVLLYCTGYEFSYPFLSDSCGIKVVGRQVNLIITYYYSIVTLLICVGLTSPLFLSLSLF